MTGSYAGNGIVSNDTTSVSLLNLEQLTFIGGSAAGAAAHDPDDLIMYDSTNGNLSYDADGNGGGVAQIFAVVSRGLPMSASNFLLAWVESVQTSRLVLMVFWTASWKRAVQKDSTLGPWRLIVGAICVVAVATGDGPAAVLAPHGEMLGEIRAVGCLGAFRPGEVGGESGDQHVVDLGEIVLRRGCRRAGARPYVAAARRFEAEHEGQRIDLVEHGDATVRPAALLQERDSVHQCLDILVRRELVARPDGARG